MPFPMPLEALARRHPEACRGCGGSMAGKRPDALCCSPACYWRAWARRHPRQGTLPGIATPPAEVKAARLKRSALRVLGRLQQGPATNVELVGVGGMRFGARIYELRQAGHQIKTDEDKGRGIVTYSLEASGGTGLEEVSDDNEPPGVACNKYTSPVEPREDFDDSD